MKKASDFKSKDEYIEYLESELAKFDPQNVIFNSFNALRKQIEDGNALCQDYKITTADVDDKEDKGFERVTTFMKNVKQYLGDMMYCYSLLSPEQKDIAEPEKKFLSVFERAKLE